MSDINVVVMAGRLCTDPVLRFTNDGMAVANLRLASNRKRKDREDVTYIDITVFGKLAESVAEHRRKGDQISVNGPLSLQQWEDKDGAKHSKHFIIANEISYGPRAKADEPVATVAAPRKPGNGKDHTAPPEEDDITF